MNKVNIFKKLHQQDNLLHIGNVWNAQSALAFEKMGYTAVGTSSAAIADTLGYEDGEKISFDDLLYVVKSILNNISIPLTVDIEAGYSRNVEDIIRHVNQLSEMGVVGVNLEDSLVDEKNHRDINSLPDFISTVFAIKKGLNEKNNDIFINVRTDHFLMGSESPLEKTMACAEEYQQAGADGLFVPCVTNESDIQRIVDSVSIPVNVMAMPSLPSFLKLKELGVKRVSSGPFIYQELKKSLDNRLEYIEKKQSFAPLFESGYI